MTDIAPPAAKAETFPAHEQPASREAAPASTAPEPPLPQNGLLTPELIVEIDAEAARFVAKIVDGATDEVVRQYPYDSQLAFARAVRAYFAALNGPKSE